MKIRNKEMICISFVRLNIYHQDALEIKNGYFLTMTRNDKNEKVFKFESKLTSTKYLIYSFLFES